MYNSIEGVYFTAADNNLYDNKYELRNTSFYNKGFILRPSLIFMDEYIRIRTNFVQNGYKHLNGIKTI